MDNPEKLASYGTQDEEKHNTICVGHQNRQANANKSWALWHTIKLYIESVRSHIHVWIEHII
jgi:hypothetical protein